ncbi:MAG: sigma-70 family RNA polymerase sigma factor [Phycisphaerales bacterium]|nr:sigma-70 family RNA polymerase sigma factor [Phycisphaerales bacterium]
MTVLELKATDTELISSFLEGNEDALQKLILRYKDKIYTSIYMLVKDKYLAEDLFQDAFLKMIRNMREGRYIDQGKFLSWASRIAHNLCMDHFRRTHSKISITLASGEDIMELLAGPDYTNVTNFEQRQTEQSIRQLLEQLPEEQREVIVLRIYGDMSFKEIAQISQVSINTALGRMRYGLINLRRMMGGERIGIKVAEKTQTLNIDNRPK